MTKQTGGAVCVKNHGGVIQEVVGHDLSDQP